MSALSTIPPSIVLILGGLLIPLIRGRLRNAALLGLPVLALGMVWTLPEGVVLSGQFLGFQVIPLKVDALSRVFGTIFTVMSFTGVLFAIRQARLIELCAAFVYAGASLGVVFAGDLITVFVYWEIMALGSTMVLWSAGTPQSYRASLRYLLVHLFGGVVLMVGIVAWAHSQGSVEFQVMTQALEGSFGQAFAAAMILSGFLLNAGAPPFSAWLPDAYPEASPSGAVFLSAFTTKTAVYVLIRGFPGAEVLMFVGLYMVFYGIVYALLENDMRRILAYSIINQVGFMVTGVGIGTAMALNGATAHAFTHIIYKALLLMSAGGVLYMTGRRKCTDLGGLVQSMPLTAVCGIVGALAISSFPLTSGFISKSMIAQAAADEHLGLIWILLAAASAGVFLHAGIKFPWFVFFQKDSGLRPPDPPWNMCIAMVMFAALCILLGIAPGGLYEILPYPVDYRPYTAAHVVAQLQLLLFSGLAFFVLLPLMKRTLTLSLDFDWFYRRFPVLVLPAAERLIGAVRGTLTRLLFKVLRAGHAYLARSYGNRQGIARVSASGAMASVVLGIFGLTLLLLYLR